MTGCQKLPEINESALSFLGRDTFNGYGCLVGIKTQSEQEATCVPRLAVAGAPDPGNCGSFWKQRDGDGKLAEAWRRM
jgi:hypothetical protein